MATLSSCVVSFSSVCSLFLSVNGRADPSTTEAQALVECWRVAQNTGDFAAYEKLYAVRFFGLRRSGERSAHFDRAGWMKDRRHMFNGRNAMKVDVDRLELETVPGGVRATFVQRYTQGGYSDEGTKEIYFHREGKKLLIADERLLDSTMKHLARPASKWTSAIGLVAPEGVVVPVEARLAWATAEKPRRKRGKHGRQVTRWAVAQDRFPEAARLLVEQTLELIDDKGSSCVAKVRGLALYAIVAVDTSTVDGQENARDDMSPHSYASPRLVAELDHACEGAIVARDQGTSGRVSVAKETKDAAILKMATDAVRAHPMYRALGVKYDPTAKKQWETSTTIRTMDVELAAGARTWISVTLRDDGACAESRELWALYELDPTPQGPKLTLLNRPGGGKAWCRRWPSMSMSMACPRSSTNRVQSTISATTSTRVWCVGSMISSRRSKKCATNISAVPAEQSYGSCFTMSSYESGRRSR